MFTQNEVVGNRARCGARRGRRIGCATVGSGVATTLPLSYAARQVVAVWCCRWTAGWDLLYSGSWRRRRVVSFNLAQGFISTPLHSTVLLYG